MKVEINAKVCTVVTDMKLDELKKFENGVTVKDEEGVPVYTATFTGTKQPFFTQYGIGVNTKNAAGLAVYQFDVPEGTTGQEFAEKNADALQALEACTAKVNKQIADRSALVKKVADSVEVR